MADPESTVADPNWFRPLLWTALPVLGAVAGWLLTQLANWLVALPWAPMQGPARLLTAIPQPHLSVAALLVGTCAGLSLAHIVEQERLVVTVAPGRVGLTSGGATQMLPQVQVGAVFLDRNQLVLLDHSGAELYREACDLDASRLGPAFQRHGFPWRADGDPYQHQYRRWVPDVPDLPPGGEALLRARQRALEQNDRDDAAQLRTELAKLGIVVRDEKNRQYWRGTEQPPPA